MSEQMLLQAGYGDLKHPGNTAAPFHAQTVPPLPRTPELLLKRPSEQEIDWRVSANAVAGPSSAPLENPENTIPKESLPEPAPPPRSTVLSTPAPPDERRSTPPLPRISCKGWSVSGLREKYANFREVRRVKASVLASEPSQVLQDYERSGEPLIVEDLHKHPKWREELLSMEWLLRNASDKGLSVLVSPICLTTGDEPIS